VIVFELGCGVPAYAPELNPVDVWSLLKRSIDNVAAADLRIEPLLSRLLLSIY
jgi:hypothetical protein